VAARIAKKSTTKTKAKTKKAEATRPFVRVWKLVQRIPRGKVATYGQLSRMIERRLTPIAIGWALRAAPEGAIPWHRVVNASGGLSTDVDHPGLQRSLLKAEGIEFEPDGTIDLTRHAWRPRARA
jgi:methylated-DNA-protein-cysteine methyltransferase related protein